MLPYTEAEKAVIKSNLHIGANRPNAQVIISGAPNGEFQWQESYTEYDPHTGNADYHPSCVELEDGSILYMYSRGTTPGVLYQAAVADVATFIGGANTVTSETTVLSNLYYPRATIFWGPEGGLYFAVTYTKTTTEDVAKVLIYKSALKDGSDWALHGTVLSVSWGGSTYMNNPEDLPLGIPYFVGSRWLLPFLNYYSYSGFLTVQNAIASSTDGITWTVEYSDGDGPGGDNCTEEASRNIGEINGDLWWCWLGNYSNNNLHFIKSSDGGLTWVEAFTVTDNLAFITSTLISDNEKLYLIGNDSNIYVADSSPTEFADFVDTAFSVPSYNRHEVACEVGDTLVILNGISGVKVIGTAISSATLPVKSITIEPIKNAAGQAVIVADNKGGLYAPDSSGDWHNVIWPNKSLSVKLGYGSNVEVVFEGLIDTIAMKTFPQEMTIYARDYIKRALDQTVTDDAGLRSLSYTDEALEDIFIDLAERAGWATGDIYCDTSGITTSITFTHETYADAFQKLCELNNFEYHAGRSGELFFHYVTDRQPEAVDEEVTLNGTTAEDLVNFPVVTASIRVRSAGGGGGTLYSSATDYEITEGDKDSAWTIKRRTGSTIMDGQKVYVSYVWAAWVFEEGKDIFSLGYSLDDADIYKTITVLGRTPTDTVCHGNSTYASAGYYNVLDDKVLIVEDENATSAEQCEDIADRMMVTMGAKVRMVEFLAVGNPYLWVGDCIMVIESSSTISEIYRIASLKHEFNDRGFTTSITAYYYGYAPS